MQDQQDIIPQMKGNTANLLDPGQASLRAGKGKLEKVGPTLRKSLATTS